MIVVIAALLSLVAVGTLIQLAPRYGWRKSIRPEGPQSHLVKAGTATLGGAAFLLASVVTWLLFGRPGVDSLAVVLLTLAIALLGLYDDMLALRRADAEAAREAQAKDKLPTEETTSSTPAPSTSPAPPPEATTSATVDVTTGLLARYRLLVQTLAALAFAIYAVRNDQVLFGSPLLDTLGFTFIIVGSINALNLSDGVDGLAAGMTAIILLPFIGVSFVGALIGSLLGYLWFNAYPARVFMGGVGSEALGAAIAGTVILAGWVWWLPLIALMPVLVVLSVMLQVSYFRLTGGKRILKKSPLHHHFEESGWSEAQVTTRFWLVTAVCVALAWGLKGGLQ